MSRECPIGRRTVDELKRRVIAKSHDASFKHSEWFAEYHLGIAARIVDELCQVYPEAYKPYAETLVWLHDYEKIIDFDNQYNTELLATRALMQDLGYTAHCVESTAEDIILFNRSEHLASASIELQIVSSADAASHLVGPFFALYWHENCYKSIAELQQDNLQKLRTDWERKVTLPEIRTKFAMRHRAALEIAGILPTAFLR
jgi:hypothetical protein